MPTPPYLTASFYKFVPLHDLTQRRAAVQRLCQASQVKGLILLAAEGINGSIAGSQQSVEEVLAALRSDPLLSDLRHKSSWSDKEPFYRMKVRLKKEIVTLGMANVSPTQMAGTYVPPQDWNALISAPDVVVIDTRNDYEVALGTFQGALNPGIRSFSELPRWLANTQALRTADGGRPRVAMFCTGGIRCEKSTALLRAQGYEEVYHLEGGILKYLETVPAQDSLWQGECFVFDERVSVGHGLSTGSHQLCRACRQPLQPGATESPLYEPGVSCPRCHDSSSEAHKRSARERQKQWELAKARQLPHLGANMRKPQDDPKQ